MPTISRNDLLDVIKYIVGILSVDVTSTIGSIGWQCRTGCVYRFVDKVEVKPQLHDMTMLRLQSYSTLSMVKVVT